METPPYCNARQLATLVHEAAERIRSEVIQTPLIRLPWLEDEGNEVWAKLECWQRTGSFKYRGAVNALMQDQSQRTVTTSSAGNHGLAIATVARAFGRSAVVFVPASASELKVRRIAALGAEVMSVGRDLLEATIFAQAEAARRNWQFISPYADPVVAAGNGTSIVEETGTGPGWDTVIVPVGGGGLIAAVGAYLKDISPSTKVIGVHPHAFGRGNIVRDFEGMAQMPVLPSVADGLAVQQPEGNPLLRNFVEVVDRMIEASEASIYMAIYALLHLEGVLAEGAGAIAVGALMNSFDGMATGRTLLMITGGNISSTEVARALVVEVSNTRVRKLLDLRNSALTVETVTPQSSLPGTRRSDGGVPAANLLAAWRAIVASAAKSTDEACELLSQHFKYADDLGLREDSIVRKTLGRIGDTARLLASQADADSEDALWRLEARLRLLVQCNRLLHHGLAWNSAATNQSREVNFFDPAEQRSAQVNYARYGSPKLGTFELHLCEALGFDPLKQTLLATSSGMAAYQLIESFLLREVLQASDWMVYAPYIYFEAAEQIRELRMLRHFVTTDYTSVTLVREVERLDARVLWLDPIANLVGTCAIDFRAVAEHARGDDWTSRWLVIDGSMISGGFNPFDIFSYPDSPKVLYYESGSKYLQWGMDLQMHGVVVADRSSHPRLHQLRRRSGTIMYPSDVTQFPQFERVEYLARLRHLTANAAQLAAAIRSDESLISGVEVGFCDRWQELGWNHGGAIVTVTFVRPGLNNRDHLEGLIEQMLMRARVLNVGLTEGVSFGFSCTRVSAAAAMAEGTDPFLRFSVGEASPQEMENLCTVVLTVLRDANDRMRTL